MRKHLSVLMLFTRSTLYRFLWIIFAMAAAQSVLFVFAFRSARGFFGLNTILGESRLQIVCAGCFLLLCALLCLTGSELGSKQRYTLSRLSISRKMVFVWQAVNNATLLLLFWAAQIIIIFVFCNIYMARYQQPQAAMLVFYSSDFLHGLLPLGETGRLISVLVLLIALSLTSACVPARMRRGKNPVAFLAIALLCVLFFNRAKGSVVADFVLSILMITISVFTVHGVWRGFADEELS